MSMIPASEFFFDLDEPAFRTHPVGRVAPPTWLPVNRLIDTRKLLGWFRDNASWITDKQIELADGVATALREYAVPTYVVSGADEADLRLVFDRLNTFGVRMTREEVFNALHAGVGDAEPNTLQGISDALASIGFGRLDERLLLRCIIAYRGGDPFRDFRGEFDSDRDRANTFAGVQAALREVIHFLRDEAGIPHVMALPYTNVLPVLTRMVRLHGRPADRLARLLRRWMWRAAAGAVQAGGISVPAIRRAISAVGVDPYASVDALLSLAPSRRPPEGGTDIRAVHLNHASTKMNILGLLSVGPLDLATNEPIDPGPLFDEGKPLRAIAPNIDTPLASTMANRVLLRTDSRGSIVAEVLQASPATCKSHLIDESGRLLLAQERYEEFLQHRLLLVRHAVTGHADAMAEWGARGGRTLGDMMRTAAQ